MIEWLLALLVSAIVGGYVGLWLHETTHYVLGYLAGGSPRFVCDYPGVPAAVAFDTRGRMTDGQVRAAAGATVAWPVLAVLVWASMWIPSTWAEFTLGFTLAGAIVVSPSDVLGLLYPDRWRVYAERGEEGSHRQAICLLLSGSAAS